MAAFVFHGCDGIHPVHDCHRQRGPILRTYQNDVQKRKTGPSPLDQLTTETLELISRDGQHLSKLEYNTDKPNLTPEEDTRLNKLNISSLLKHDFIIHCSWNNINTVIYKSMPFINFKHASFFFFFKMQLSENITQWIMAQLWHLELNVSMLK